MAHSVRLPQAYAFSNSVPKPREKERHADRVAGCKVYGVETHTEIFKGPGLRTMFFGLGSLAESKGFTVNQRQTREKRDNNYPIVPYPP